jgi:diguanylate cyclase (GGDEF)-like protein/PAS domain S-box-containing protein
MLRRRTRFKPLESRGRRVIVAIVLTFTLVSAATLLLSIRGTARARHRAAVIEVAARQRMLADRYVSDVLLVREGKAADPAQTARLLAESAKVLLDGGAVPAVPGDDDDAALSPVTDPHARAELVQAQHLVADLTATGQAVLARTPPWQVGLTGQERLDTEDPIQRLTILAALMSNVSLNAARSIGTGADNSIENLLTMQIALGIAGLLISLLLAWALIAVTRRQTAHFRTLVSASTDLVMVFVDGGCGYVSHSVATTLGRADAELLGGGFASYIHADDRPVLDAAVATGSGGTVELRVRNAFDEWRHLEAVVTDLRQDRLVRGVVLNARDITERVRLEEQLMRQAFHDDLTGLANRVLFRDRLDHALARSADDGDGLAVLLIDLDGFKKVNDTLGHDAGDRLLREVARRFEKSMTRATDTVARLGGDEFAILLEVSSETRAIDVAARLLAAVALPVMIEGREVALSGSVGIAVHVSGTSGSEEMIRRADIAMYAAKDAGRGRYEVFHPDMTQTLGELVGLEHELRVAIERSELTVHYQPEIAVATGVIAGVEALVRWLSPSLGQIPPSTFVPVAEQSGLIGAIGEFVIGDSCTQTAAWEAAGLLPDGFRTWINVSGKQLVTGTIVGTFERALTAAGLSADRIGIEVTETAVIQEGPAGERAFEELQTLRDRGIRIAIDDFGTGFSSLGQLRRFPIDVVKVDRTFIQGIEHNAKDAAITGNVVSLAHALGLVAVAEGVETGGQLASLRRLGCDLAQGYLFARPDTAESVTQLLDQSRPQREAA